MSEMTDPNIEIYLKNADAHSTLETVEERLREELDKVFNGETDQPVEIGIKILRSARPVVFILRIRRLTE